MFSCLFSLICIVFMYVFLWFIISFFLIVCFSVTVKWLAVKTAPEMTYTVSSGALNSTQSYLVSDINVYLLFFIVCDLMVLCQVFFSSMRSGSSCQIYFMTLNRPGLHNWWLQLTWPSDGVNCSNFVELTRLCGQSLSLEWVSDFMSSELSQLQDCYKY